MTYPKKLYLYVQDIYLPDTYNMNLKYKKQNLLISFSDLYRELKERYWWRKMAESLYFNYSKFQFGRSGSNMESCFFNNKYLYIETDMIRDSANESWYWRISFQLIKITSHIWIQIQNYTTEIMTTFVILIMCNIYTMYSISQLL